MVIVITFTSNSNIRACENTKLDKKCHWAVWGCNIKNILLSLNACNFDIPVIKIDTLPLLDDPYWEPLFITFWSLPVKGEPMCFEMICFGIFSWDFWYKDKYFDNKVTVICFPKSEITTNIQKVNVKAESYAHLLDFKLWK